MYQKVILVENLLEINKRTGHGAAVRRDMRPGTKALVISLNGKSLRELERRLDGTVTVNLLCYEDYGRALPILARLTLAQNGTKREKLEKLITNLCRFCAANGIVVPGGNPVLA